MKTTKRLIAELRHLLKMSKDPKYLVEGQEISVPDAQNLLHDVESLALGEHLAEAVQTYIDTGGEVDADCESCQPLIAAVTAFYAHQKKVST